jgi:hypothetical protein
VLHECALWLSCVTNSVIIPGSFRAGDQEQRQEVHAGCRVQGARLEEYMRVAALQRIIHAHLKMSVRSTMYMHAPVAEPCGPRLAPTGTACSVVCCSALPLAEAPPRLHYAGSRWQHEWETRGASHRHSALQHSHADPCIPSCDHPLTSARSGNQLSSTTPAFTRRVHMKKRVVQELFEHCCARETRCE